MIIAIEGTDGAGKATQAKLLVERINKAGREAVLYSFPRYDTPTGKVLLRMLKSELLLFEQGHEYDPVRRAPEEKIVFRALMLADKTAVMQEFANHLEDGKIIVCDRWIPSSLCYGAAEGLDQEWISSLYFPLLDANLNVFIEVSPEEALRRRPEIRDRFERDRELQARVREEYAKLWGCAQGGARIWAKEGPFYEMWLRLNGERSVDVIADDIFKTVLTHPLWIEVEAPRLPKLRENVS